MQTSLDAIVVSWNHHKGQMAANKSCIAIYKLSRQHAINHGYWSSDPGDDIATASDPSYGHDPTIPIPPADKIATDPSAPIAKDYPNATISGKIKMT
jgi:hypothetical protein